METSGSSAAELADPSGHGLSVLVVDDEPMLADELSDGLRQEGFHVATANSAAEALTLLRADPGIGGLVSDIRMPGGTGLSLAAEVLGNQAAGDTRGVILITAHGSMDQAVEAMRSGVCDFLTKPFGLADAVRAVRAAMARALAGRAAAADRTAADLKLVEAAASGRDLADRLAEARAQLETAAAQLPEDDGEAGNRLRLLAHELRTPLVPVLGFAEILESGEARSPEATQHYGQYLREAGERLLETVDKLLTYERLRGRPPRLLEPVDVHALMVEAVARTRRLASLQDVHVAIGPLLCDGLLAEPADLVAGLSALLDNAIRATPAHGTVEIGAERASGRLRLVVRDRGHGVSAALLADPGRPYTVDGSTLNRRRDGLGLGLAIARLAVERHGGRLTLVARPEGGTEAALDLPAG